MKYLPRIVHCLFQILPYFSKVFLPKFPPPPLVSPKNYTPMTGTGTKLYNSLQVANDQGSKNAVQQISATCTNLYFSDRDSLASLP